MTRVLVLNSGSSSLKLQVLDTALPESRSELAWVLVERIGEESGHLRIRRTDATGLPADERTAEASRRSATGWSTAAPTSTSPCW